MALLDRVQRAGQPPPEDPPPDKDAAPAKQGALESALLERMGPSARLPRNRIPDTHGALRAKVQSRLVEEIAEESDNDPAAVRRRVVELVTEMSRDQGIVLSRSDATRLVELVMRDVLGLGPLDDLLNDEHVTEIMVNGANKVYIELDGKMQKSTTRFDSNDQLMQVIDRIVSGIGRRIDESSPMVDARLKDGSRVHIIIPPLALQGPTITIRKFSRDPLTEAEMVTNGTATQEMMDFLHAAVHARLNIAVSGGGSSGKTTTLNVLSSYIPDDERIITIEDAAELQLRQIHVVPLETRPANVEGKGRVTIRDLVINSLRMRPDRIIIGECRGPEALDMLQAMNTGHDGSMTTIHANSAKEVVTRLETLVLMAGADLPSRAIREQIASAIQIIVQQSRLHDGSRKITSITEVIGIDQDEVLVQDIFRYKQVSTDAQGMVHGYHTGTGTVPYCTERLAAEGINLPEEMFAAREPELV